MTPETLQFADPSVGKGKARLFGKWRIGKCVGSGGLGWVHLAKHVEDGRLGALKYLREEVRTHRLVSAHFWEECRVAVGLRHENVLYGVMFGASPEGPYLVTKYIPGETLAELIKGHDRLSPEIAMMVMEQLFEGLNYLHRRQVAHLDLKPVNIMITPQGVLKLIDFGLVMDRNTPNLPLHKGGLMGSPSFMSPEQCVGRRGDERSDLYSCGVLLFTMLTGRTPFYGSTAKEIMTKQVRKDPPSIRRYNEGVSSEMEQAVHRLMAKRSKERFATVAEARAALRASF